MGIGAKALFDVFKRQKELWPLLYSGQIKEVIIYTFVQTISKYLSIPFVSITPL